MTEEIELREEVPVDKSCCFCFPLRYGLTKWGYFKMVVTAFFILVISYALLHTCMMLRHIGNGNHRNRIYVDIAVTSVALSFFVTDLLMTMPFIVGAYQKNANLLKPFYIFSVVTWSVTILLSALAVSVSLECWLSRYMSLRSLVITLTNFSAYYIIIIVQTYFLLLLRGEIIKMRNNVEVKYMKDTVEAECTITCEEKMAGDIKMRNNVEVKYMKDSVEAECTITQKMAGDETETEED